MDGSDTVWLGQNFGRFDFRPLIFIKIESCGEDTKGGFSGAAVERPA
jgi:hypothetical protein